MTALARSIRMCLLALATVSSFAPTISAQPIIEVINETGDGIGNPLEEIGGVATDASGNAYVVGFLSGNVFQITPDGDITEILGTTTSGAGTTLPSPQGIDVDTSGNIYVAGERIVKIVPGGAITDILDETGDGLGNQCIGSVDIALGPSGNAYVVCTHSNNVFQITPGGAITEIIDETGDGAGNVLDFPGYIAVGSDENVYVSGRTSDNAFRITPGGAITQIIDQTGDGSGRVLSFATGVAVDSLNNVYVAGGSSNNAFQITPGGTITEIIRKRGQTVALDFPVDVAVDSADVLYVSGYRSHDAYQVWPDGSIITKIIDSNGDGAGNRLSKPIDIAIGPTGVIGVLYIASFDNDKIFQVDEPAIALNETLLTPQGMPGNDALPYPFTVTNSGGLTLIYDVSVDVPWMSVNPVSGDSAGALGGQSTGEADTIDVVYDSSLLSEGVHNGTITVTDPGAVNDPQTIDVVMTVTPASILDTTEATPTPKVLNIPGLNIVPAGSYAYTKPTSLLPQSSISGNTLFHVGGSLTFTSTETPGTYRYSDWIFELRSSCAGNECLVTSTNDTPGNAANDAKPRWKLRNVDLVAGTAEMVFTNEGANDFDKLRGKNRFNTNETFATVTFIPEPSAAALSIAALTSLGFIRLASRRRG